MKSRDKDESEKSEIEIQKDIAFTAGLLQGDITIKRLLESIAEGVVIINEVGRIIIINQRFADMCGFSKFELMGKDLNVLIHPEKHEKHKAHLAHFFENPRVRPMGIGLELWIQKKDKKTFPVEISISYLELESGKIGIAFITDNTERKRAIDSLTRRNVELDAYAHTVAHDLKSSIVGITGFSELLLDKSLNLDSDEKDGYIKIISEGSRKMHSIIKELLLFASMDKSEIQLTKFNMKNTIEGACKRLEFQAEQNKATIKVNEKIIDCTSYSPWIEEVWYNYISNAIKYSGENPQITISSKKEKNGYIKYCVSDKGIGLSNEELENIFKEKSTSKVMPLQGTGFGLSIVKRIIEKLDGYVCVNSKQGEGSEFCFFLKA